ncbi:MAG TPA: NADPH:quinone oxidoreductase family protein [Solirubrobacteraceae bacterium]|nr:NADPH:quinone oxidoreductase family protein [Solirubrobacteraceae bacterium]
MRAIQITEFGGPEVLQLVDLPRPEPKEGEVLIRVTRAGMNFADTHTRENTYLAKAELPLIPGGEVAGVREDTGERVVALLAGSGGYAEYAVAPEASVVPIPGGLAEEAALAMLVQGTTAWHLYRTAAKLAEGESVVVHAAAGGTGSLCVQLGKSFGAGRVIATASTDDKRRLALDLGADAAVDSAPDGMAERLIEANGGERVDVVLEMAGGRVFEESRKALAPFGRLVTYGIASREQNEVRTGSLMRRSQGVVGFWLAHLFGRPGMFEQALTDLFARAASGELRVVAGPTYPLSEARQAQIDLAERRTTGKVTLDVTR